MRLVPSRPAVSSPDVLRAHRRRARGVEGAGRRRCPRGRCDRPYQSRSAKSTMSGSAGGRSIACAALPMPALSSLARARSRAADDLGSEWKFVPVRRMALFLEESVLRGTKWAAFEPNAEPLWAEDTAQRRRTSCRCCSGRALSRAPRRAMPSSSSATATTISAGRYR